MGGFSLGIVLGWTSPILPFLTNCNDQSSIFNTNFNNCTLPKAFTKEEGSWISSLFGIGALFSCAITGILMSKIGRKWTLIALNGPLLLGWMCLLIPAYKTDITNPYWFYVGRILTGLGTGGFAAVGPVYISEVTETSIRGSIGTESLQPFDTINLSTYCKVTSSRLRYYSILDSFSQTSQYIRIKFALHKQSVNPWVSY